MTIHELTKNISRELQKIYDTAEALNLATWLVEYVTGYDKSLIALSKTIQVTQSHQENIHILLSRMLNHEPIQYVLEEAWFYGMRFFVNKHVLIPRPETEELVDWIIKENRQRTKPIKVLDIGTGSGCIPIVLKKYLPAAEVLSLDVSAEALEVAKQNATTKNLEINFIQLDFLDSSTWNDLPKSDIIVSNPPYVTFNEKSSMRENVLNYEPHTALFVPDEDPLVFYRAIAEFGKTHLNEGGQIYCELNADLGEKTRELFNEYGYKSELKLDMQGNQRMMRMRRT